MIRLRSHGSIPKNYNGSRVHYLTCRKTIFGVHRTLPDESSKTCIVCFTDTKSASRFKDELSRGGYTVVRYISPTDIEVTKTTGGGLLPVTVETTTMLEMMKICHLNFFDMYLVFTVDDSTYSHFDFETSEMPTRGYVNSYFELLLHTNS